LLTVNRREDRSAKRIWVRRETSSCGVTHFALLGWRHRLHMEGVLVSGRDLFATDLSFILLQRTGCSDKSVLRVAAMQRSRSAEFAACLLRFQGFAEGRQKAYRSRHATARIFRDRLFADRQQRGRISTSIRDHGVQLVRVD
jgi:hypothetical protein